MLIDGSHKAWCGATLTLLALASGAYGFYARTALDGPRGGSVPGLIFGIVGSALMIYAGLISARKKAPAWRIGSAQTWLRGHLWLGSLSIPLILFHASFRWGGPVEQALLWVLAAIVASGAFGLVLQQFMPRQMTARVPLETFYAQVPHVCRVLEVEADVAVAQLCGPLPLQVGEHDDVATVERLNQLGVSGKNPQAAVYAPELSVSVADRRNGDAESGSGGDAEMRAPKVTAAMREVRDPPGPAATPKPVSAADKIAMMRAAKAAKKPDEAASAPAPASSEPANVAAGAKPKPALSAADKIAMMRTAKKPAEAVTPPPAAEKPTSAAEKIALMRAGKAALAGNPTSAAPAAPSPAAASKPSLATKPAPAAKPTKADTDDDAWKEARPQFVKFYLEQVRPFLGIDDHRQSLLADVVQAEGQFAAVAAVLPERFRPLVDRLAALCDERRQLAAQVRMHHWLHGWLLLHVPLSLALLALGVVHVIASLYY